MSFELQALLTILIWMAVALKLTVDQMRLFKAYKEEIDSTFRITLTAAEAITNYFPLIRKRLGIVFGHFPENPHVDLLAKKVRRDILAALVVLVLIFAVPLLIELQ